MQFAKSPLRYPGGKQKLTPFIEEVITANALEGCEYAEPYAGGAGVGISLLLSGVVSRIHLNDSCRLVYAFWRSVISKTEEICRRISRASLNVDEWKRHRAIVQRPLQHCSIDVGFSFFYLNRCNRSGIINGGLIGGLNQNGTWKMDARFPRKELINRIEAIASKRKMITVKNLDAEKYIESYIGKMGLKTLVYCDPPYFNKADRLYPNYYLPTDHCRLAKFVQSNLKQPWLVSYDAAAQILENYSGRRSLIYDLQYNASRAYKGREIFVFSDKVIIPNRSRLPFIQSALTRAS
ncbi:MAG: DNA adenine methylase [Gemmatales bacterium]